jgi:glycosyltransferase involved in cell wall biosynthesis
MQFFLPFELKKLKIKKLYAPMNMGPIFLRFFNIKLILGLHSNLPWVYFSKMPGNFFRNIFTKFLMEKSIFACDTLIVDSKFAKNEIINLLKIKENKVFAIHLGIDKKYLNLDNNKDYLNNFEYNNYIISVLSCVKYHNIINLLKAFKLLKKEKNIDLKFIFVLQILDKKYFSTIKDFISNNFEKHEIVFLHNLDNKYLVNLYRKATFYIFSSYCEVFGLTSLEAMSQGCPVLISKRSALSEIYGEAAEYFDPDNKNQIKESMNKILSDVNYRNDIIAKSRIHSKKFRWEKTVQETIKILDV